MQNIEDYSPSVSKYELFAFLYTKVINLEIKSFSELINYTKNINFKKVPDGQDILADLFKLIRRLNWGFFKRINAKDFPKLWNEIVVADRDYPFAGDLKRSMSLATLYIGMLDIHGYTKFSEENKNNLSRMHKLDVLMQTDIERITKFYNVISRRERGDEVVMVGTTATDILSATIAIIGALSRNPMLDEAPKIDMQDLPDFKVSAGIAGGNSNTPLIVTESGDLAGYLLNNAARMQTRASSLNSKVSKIIFTKTIQYNFETENAQKPSELFRKRIISFYENGAIYFKGTDINIVEAIFDNNEKYKEAYYGDLDELLKSVKGNLWKQKIFTAIINLIIKVCKVCPPFQIDEHISEYISTCDNSTIHELCLDAQREYVEKENYKDAVIKFENIIKFLKKVDGFDKLVVEYAEGICEHYKKLTFEYDKIIAKEIENNLASIFPANQINLFMAAKKTAFTYEKLLRHAETHQSLTKKKTLWYTLIEKELPSLIFNLYSGKK